MQATSPASSSVSLRTGRAASEAMSMPGWRLRPATVADAPALATLHLSTRRRWLPYAPPAHSDDEVQAYFAQQLLPAGGASLVEGVDGDVLAYLVAQPHDGGSSWISHLYVRADLPGQGLGGWLLAQMLASLQRPVRLYTFQANAGARRFYERAGFAPVTFGDGSGNEEGCPDVLYELR